jgi:hypothetical protein
MPTPLSEKVAVIGVRIDRDLDRERSAILDELGRGDRLIAQLLTGVGGVGDELADENFPVPNRANGPSDAAGPKRRPRSSASWRLSLIGVWASAVNSFSS